MTSEHLEKKIREEISEHWEISNAHGVDLQKCLIKPLKQKYFSFDRKEIYELWTVLEEIPDGSGYKIVYDEKTDLFGLGVLSNKDELINIGFYGDFLNTLESM